MPIKKLCITYICTGKYNQFFKDFYQSYKDNFCKNHQVSFVIITDNPSLYSPYRDCKVYNVQRYYKQIDLNFIKFRKWRDILLSEDYLMTQDYCFYFNSNLICNKKVDLDELFQGKEQYAVYHSLFNSKTLMYESLCKNPKSAAFFDAQDKNQYPNYTYFQAGNVGATTKQFLKLCHYIESSRYFDEFYDLSKYVPWHDETYYNKYINTIIKKDPQSINILDGKIYLCTWLNQLKPYVPVCKMILRNKDAVWQGK